MSDWTGPSWFPLVMALVSLVLSLLAVAALAGAGLRFLQGRHDALDSHVACLAGVTFAFMAPAFVICLQVI